MTASGDSWSGGYARCGGNLDLMKRPGRRRGLRIAGIILLVLLVSSIAGRPAKLATPRPMLAGAQVDAQVLSILRRSCADCHSESTRYPWYSYVAPVSWLIRMDVTGGRERMNLSEWGQFSLVRKERFLSEIANQVRDRDMPLPQYTLIHRDARLSDAEVDAIFRWTQAERARLISSAAPQ
jgi:hypothetical protein